MYIYALCVSNVYVHYVMCVLGQHFASYLQMPKQMGAVLSGMIMCVNV